MKTLVNDQKNTFLGELLATFFTSFSQYLPLRVIYEDNLVIAFEHPRPVYNNHILIIPKAKIRDLKELSKRTEYCAAVFKSLDFVTNLPQYTKGFKFVSNFGSFQKVKQVHFHVYTH